jgi:hypothetical protein
MGGIPGGMSPVLGMNPMMQPSGSSAHFVPGPDGGHYVCNVEEMKTDENGFNKMVKCNMTYKQARGRIVHIQEYHDKVKFTCPALTCQRVYSRKWEMRKHFNRAHPEKNFEDEIRIYEEQKHNLDQL